MKHKMRYIIQSITIFFGLLCVLKVFFDFEIFPIHYMIWPIGLWMAMDFILYPWFNIKGRMKKVIKCLVIILVIFFVFPLILFGSIKQKVQEEEIQQLKCQIKAQEKKLELILE